MRKAIATARPGTAEQNFGFYKSRFPKKSDVEIIDMMTSSGKQDFDRKLKAIGGGQKTTLIWANSTYGDKEEFGGVIQVDNKGKKKLSDGTTPIPGKKYYDSSNDTFIMYDKEGIPTKTTPPEK